MPRRQELLDATVEYILDNGVSDLSLRPLAAATGTKARLLIYHFESREALINAALSAILGRVQDAFVSMQRESPDLKRAIEKFWSWATNETNERYLRLVFEVHGLAPWNPELYGPYVEQAFKTWRALVMSALPKRRDRADVATIIIAAVDGLLLDYLATGDRTRTTRALRRFMKGVAL